MVDQPDGHGALPTADVTRLIEPLRTSHNDFVNQKLYDLFLIGRATAEANGRDVIQPADLPITKGLQESVHKFQKLDEEIELAPLLDQWGRTTAAGNSHCGVNAGQTACPGRWTERGARAFLPDCRP